MENRATRRLAVPLLAAAALLATLTALPPTDPASAQTTTLEVFVAPGGTGTGLSASSPVGTLQDAHSVVVALDPAATDTDVDIIIAKGTYNNHPQTNWTYSDPDITIRFYPDSYVPGQSWSQWNQPAGTAERPVFNGYGQGVGSYFFWFGDSAGANTNFEFYYLTIRYYEVGGISLNRFPVNYESSAYTDWNGNNVFWGNYFYKLGNKWNAGTADGYGALSLLNSRDNEIKFNFFDKLENTGSSGNLMHGIYLKHQSSNNTIRNNVFVLNSGDPVRVSDASNYNMVHDNTFTLAGDLAYMSDWSSPGL